VCLPFPSPGPSKKHKLTIEPNKQSWPSNDKDQLKMRDSPSLGDGQALVRFAPAKKTSFPSHARSRAMMMQEDM